MTFSHKAYCDFINHIVLIETESQYLQKHFSWAHSSDLPEPVCLLCRWLILLLTFTCFLIFAVLARLLKQQNFLKKSSCAAILDRQWNILILIVNSDLRYSILPFITETFALTRHIFRVAFKSKSSPFSILLIRCTSRLTLIREEILTLLACLGYCCWASILVSVTSFGVNNLRTTKAEAKERQKV